MKRYRWTSFFVDTRRNIVRLPGIPVSARQEIMEHLRSKYGDLEFQAKLDRWLEVEPPAICVPFEYLEFLQQIESCYVLGAFYPALTGACCLGERILNSLIMGLKKYHKRSPYYKDIARKESIDDWKKLIAILHDWGVINKAQARMLGHLKDLRHQAVHYRSVGHPQGSASKSISILYSFITSLFGEGNQCFFQVVGEFYVKKEYESDPFTKQFIIPHCQLLGVHHKNVTSDDGWIILDCDPYPEEEGTDEDFMAIRRQF